MLMAIVFYALFCGATAATYYLLKRFQKKTIGGLISFGYLIIMIYQAPSGDDLHKNIAAILGFFVLTTFPIMLLRLFCRKPYTSYPEVQTNLTKAYTALISMMHAATFAIIGGQGEPLVFILLLTSLVASVVSVTYMGKALKVKRRIKKGRYQSKNQFNEHNRQLKFDGPPGYSEQPYHDQRQFNNAHNQAYRSNQPQNNGPVKYNTNQSYHSNTNKPSYNMNQPVYQSGPKSFEEMNDRSHRSEPVIENIFSDPSPHEETLNTGIVDVNNCSEKALVDLPGINVRTAKKLIAFRDKHGSFDDVDHFLEVANVKPHLYEDVMDRVTCRTVKTYDRSKRVGRVLDY